MDYFKEIIGYEAIKKELTLIADVLRNGEDYAELGVVPPKTLLFHGEPGLGKTMMANAFIEASGRKAYVCRKDTAINTFVDKIRNIFMEAKNNTPSIILLDDMDKFANVDEYHINAEEYITVQSCLDDIMDSDVFVIATVNNLDKIPNSLLRAGRFGNKIKFEIPTRKEVEGIVKKYLEKVNLGKNLDAQMVTKFMRNQTCAELEELINLAKMYAGYDKKCVEMEHIIMACARRSLGISIYNHEATDCSIETTEKIAYHEAGHVVVSEILNPESVIFVAVENDKGGVTEYDRDMAYFNDSVKNQKGRIAVSLAGRACVEQKYGIVDYGGEGDVNNAFAIANRLVVKEATEGLRFCNMSNYPASTDLRSSQERKCFDVVENCYNKAKEILANNKEFVDKVVSELLEKRILTYIDIQRIKKTCNI